MTSAIRSFQLATRLKGTSYIDFTGKCGAQGKVFFRVRTRAKRRAEYGQDRTFRVAIQFAPDST